MSWAQWRAEPAEERGKLMAFWTAQTTREAYVSEKIKKAGREKADGFGGVNPPEQMLKRFGL